MAIKVAQAFERTAPAAIDDSLLLTKAQMLAIDDTKMPEMYFAICLDDGAMYIYNKAATPNAETGKYTKAAGGGAGGDYTAGTGIDITANVISIDETAVATKTDLEDYYTKAEADAKFSGLYKFKGSVATITDLPSDPAPEVGDTYNVEENGMNYAWDGTKWDELGSVIDLSDYYTKTEVDAELAKKIDDPDTKADGDYLKWDETEGKWIAVAGSGGSGALENAITATIDVGGIKKTKAYTAGTSFEQMWKDLIAPALNPTLTDPSASINYYGTTLLKVGAVIPAQNMILSFSRGSINPAYGTSGYRSGEATNFHIETTGADTNFTPEDQGTGTFAAPQLTRSTKGNIVVSGTVSYGAGEQPKDSEGGNYGSALSAGTKSASKTYEFILPFYYGASDTATVDLSTLTEVIEKKGNKTFSYTTVDQRIVFAYDKSYGSLTSILDQNGFETISGYNKVEQGDFFVYVSDLPTTDSGANNTFKF